MSDDKSLAIAYAIKRKAKKKMAGGGEVSNETLNPQHNAPSIAKNAVMKELTFSKKAEEHEDLEEPKEPKKEYMPASEDLPEHMGAKKMADGGPVDPMKAKSAQDSMRKAFGYADGGTVTDPVKAQSAQDSMRKAFHYAKGGMMCSPEEMVAHIRSKKANMMAEGGELEPDMDYLALNDSYPDPDHEEVETLDKHAFSKEETGEVMDEKEKRKKRMSSIFDAISED